jgi:hypothetical protein
MATIDFDPNEHEPAKDFGILPSGRYVAVITNTDIVDNRQQTGKVLKVEYSIIDGEHANRKLWSNVNLSNANPEAERIGKGELSAICAACGVTGKLTDTAVLHDIPIVLSVSIRKEAGYADSNVVKGWSTANVTGDAPAAPTRPQAPAAPRAPAPAASKPAAPWANKGKAA